MNRPDTQQAPPIGDYALIGDCHCSALVSRLGSIDWCCMPRFDSQPCFGRLLDWKRAGYCSIAPSADHFDVRRRYLEDSMVLRTRFETEAGIADLFDLLTITGSPELDSTRQLVRIVEGVEGSVELDVAVQPRFEFGDVKPWLRQYSAEVFTAVGGENGLVIWSDTGLRAWDRYSLGARVRVAEGERTPPTK